MIADKVKLDLFVHHMSSEFELHSQDTDFQYSTGTTWLGALQIALSLTPAIVV